MCQLPLRWQQFPLGRCEAALGDTRSKTLADTQADACVSYELEALTQTVTELQQQSTLRTFDAIAVKGVGRGCPGVGGRAQRDAFRLMIDPQGLTGTGSDRVAVLNRVHIETRVEAGETAVIVVNARIDIKAEHAGPWHVGIRLGAVGLQGNCAHAAIHQNGLFRRTPEHIAAELRQLRVAVAVLQLQVRLAHVGQAQHRQILVWGVVMLQGQIVLRSAFAGSLVLNGEARATDLKLMTRQTVRETQLQTVLLVTAVGSARVGVAIPAEQCFTLRPVIPLGKTIAPADGIAGQSQTGADKVIASVKMGLERKLALWQNQQLAAAGDQDGVAGAVAGGQVTLAGAGDFGKPQRGADLCKPGLPDETVGTGIQGADQTRLHMGQAVRIFTSEVIGQAAAQAHLWQARQQARFVL